MTYYGKQLSVSIEKSRFLGLKAGSMINRFVFPAIDGKLNGLCNIGGNEWRGECLWKRIVYLE